MSGALSVQTRGVIPIVPTPFAEDGSLNLKDVPRLVAYYRACGVVGLTILGVMGEAGKLSHEETMSVIGAFVASAKELPVIVGVSSPSLAASAELALKAVEAGAFGAMLQPMPGLTGDAAVADYFSRFVAATDGRVPICVQDYPQANGVAIGLGAWRTISQLAPVFMLKHEPPAGLGKLSAIRAAEAEGTARRVAILTSNNAMHLPQELERGADGAMVGVALSDVIVCVCAAFREGARQLAFDLFDAILPLVRHETQGAFGLAVRKEILHRRGALSVAALRYPEVRLDPYDLTELDTLLGRAATRLEALGYDFSLERPLQKRRGRETVMPASTAAPVTTMNRGRDD